MASGQEIGLKQPWLKPMWRQIGLVMGAPILAQLLGSLFNIWYNFAYVQPLLSEAQLAAFWSTVAIYNPIAYAAGVAVWLGVTSLVHPCKQVITQQSIAPQTLLKPRE